MRSQSSSTSPVRIAELPRQLAEEVVELIAVAIIEKRDSELKEHLAAFGLKITDC